MGEIFKILKVYKGDQSFKLNVNVRVQFYFFNLLNDCCRDAMYNQANSKPLKTAFLANLDKKFEISKFFRLT
jgi:hypothetical protein